MRDPQKPIFKYHSQMQNSTSKLPQFVRSTLRKSASQQKLQKFDLQNIIARSTFSGAICVLCETRYKMQDLVITHEDCSHSFCWNCIRSYLIYKISVSEQIVCPQQGCPQVIQTNSLCFSSLPAEIINKYQQYKLWKQTINNPNLKLCPTENCKGMISKQQAFKCNICKMEFCPECMLKRHQGPCDQNFQKNFKQWKRCPNCNMFIQKNQGCNHITCRCSHEFCYFCQANWSEEHYQCGQNGIPGIHQQYLLPQDHLRNQPRGKQIVLSLLMFLLSPLALALLLALFGISITGGPAIAFIVSPFVVMCNPTSIECCERCCPCWCVLYLILLPLIMVAALVVSFFVIAYNIGIVVGSLFWAYINTAVFLLCNNDQHNQQEPFDNDLLAI